MRGDTKFTVATDLLEFPEIATLFGQYIARFSCFETFLWLLYGRILGCDETQAMRVLGEIQSFTLRLDAMERFALNAGQFNVEHTKIAFEVFRNVNRFRNRVVHGQFLTTDDRSELAVAPFMSHPGRKIVEHEISEGIFKEEIIKLIDAQILSSRLFIKEI